MAAERKATKAALIDAAVAVALCLLVNALLTTLFALPDRRSTGDASRSEPFASYAATAARPMAVAGDRVR
jgi:hypothetical protein